MEKFLDGTARIEYVRENSNAVSYTLNYTSIYIYLLCKLSASISRFYCCVSCDVINIHGDILYLYFFDGLLEVLEVHSIYIP